MTKDHADSNRSGMAAKSVKATAATTCFVLMTWTPLASAQAYPSKPIRMVIPSSAGGSEDTIGRILAHELGQVLGQTIVAENKPGASGLIGSMEVARAVADGYTLLFHASNQVYFPLATSQKTYDARKDFTPITQVGRVSLAMVVGPNLPVKTLAEFANLARVQPKAVTWAMPGVGTTGHLAAEMINRGLKLDVPLIAYKGGAPALKDVMGGHVSAYVSPLSTVGPLIKSGMVKPVAVTSSKRLPGYPNLPTVAESGIPEFEISSWYGLWGPAGLPRDLVDKLNAAAARAVQTPAATARFAELSFETTENSPAEFASLIEDEIRRVGQTIKAAGIRIDP